MNKEILIQALTDAQEYKDKQIHEMKSKYTRSIVYGFSCVAGIIISASLVEHSVFLMLFFVFVWGLNVFYVLYYHYIGVRLIEDYKDIQWEYTQAKIDLKSTEDIRVKGEIQES